MLRGPRWRTAAVAWFVGAVSFVLGSTSVVLWMIDRRVPNATHRLIAPAPALAMALSIVGALIVSRQPDNRIGHLLLAAAVLSALGAFGSTYAVASRFVRPLPGASWAEWTADIVSLPAFASSLPLIMLVFPDGRLPSRRWRPVFALAVGAPVVFAVVQAFAVVHMQFTARPNPLHSDRLQPLASAAGPLLALIFVLLPVCLASLFVRMRRASFAEREQIRWVLYAVGIGVVAAVASNLGTGVVRLILGTVNLLSIAFLPVAIGVAITRFGLYEIDRLVRRTTTYAIVTVLLGCGFAGGILVPTALLGAQRAPSWLVAVVTLVIATIFGPVLRRVRDGIDRRFDRARYDAAHTIESFGSRLKESIDMDALRRELESVVRETMHPEFVSLWAPGPRRR